MDKDGPPQSLKRDAAYVYVAYALRFLSVMILVPYYGRILGPAEYGKVLAAMSLMALVWMIVNYGFSTSGARELASSGDKAVHSHIFSRQISARLALFPAGMIVGALATWFSPVLRANPWFGAVATALGLINAMNLGWFYQGLRRFKVSLVFEAVAYPLNVIFVLILVRNTSDGIEALLANLAAAGIASSCAHMVAFRLVRPAKLGIKEGWAEIKAASTIFLLGVNSVLMASGSTYMLSILSTPSQVGYFGSVEKLVSFSLAFLQPAAQVLMPTIAHRATHASAGSQQLVKTGIQLELAYGICAAVGGTVLASPLISLAFGGKFMPSVPMMQVMACVLPFAALTHSIGTYAFLPRRHERWLVISFTIGNACNLGLIALLARSYGGIGVSVARLAGECATAAVMLYFFVGMRKRC